MSILLPILLLGATLGRDCPPIGRGFPGNRWRPRWRRPTHTRRPDPNKKRRRKARQAAQRRNR